MARGAGNSATRLRTLRQNSNNARMLRSTLILSLALCSAPALLSGCAKEGCLSGASDCRVPSPCQSLSFECSGGSVEARVLKTGDAVPGGLVALGAPGDVLLGNDKVVAVIDGIDNANY